MKKLLAQKPKSVMDNSWFHMRVILIVQEIDLALMHTVER